ncbi:MAG: putative histidine kinase, atypical hybrid [Ramlibacter sp.]|jgi:signal transduction histidine kinase|uniref:response regulator n=1 Tax=Ramlibacter sp. TaxID=1917967 RepID=UPI00262FAB9D|nr:response regulator [Ramlibacter sp.]MDB5753561.1 putative histidine kinase, atypical hybrid [Ramlibacter sp.]
MTPSELSVNILIVDDEPKNLTVLESVLDDPSYRLVRATSGNEALLALMADEFAVLVLDVRMPGMTGFELAQLIKERRKTARIPIIFLTAYYNEDQHVLEGYGTGAVDYLHKPVNPAVLRSKVSVFAELHRRGREVAVANRLLLAEVAERRRAEARLSELNASLDQRVTERTMELQDSQARLMDANRRKDEFLATLAHELRNPLAPVRNAVHFLKIKGPGTADVQWASDVIDRQIQAMGRLIDDLMDVSRISNGRIELQPELVTLETVLADAIETLQPQIDGAGHKLTLLQPPARLVVRADRARLAQVFMNLLSNAAKYTDPGGQIEVRVVREGGMAVVSVHDSGIGIAPDRLETVFEMFSQEEAALSRSRGGLGIGLSLTRKLVQMHGGTVTAGSDGAGKGSQFLVRLPLAETVAQSEHVESPAPLALAQSGPLRILVADDNRDAAETLGMLLEVMGHEVRRAYDGEAALEVLAAFDPQLVLLDLGMPRLNGYDTCRRIRELAGATARMVVAVTGWGQPRDLELSGAAGFDGHLVKPISLEALNGLIAARSVSRG